MQQAAGRLGDGSTTQAEVAAALGYADQPYRIRDFASVTGTTPGQFAVSRQVTAPARTVQTPLPGAAAEAPLGRSLVSSPACSLSMVVVPLLTE